MKVHAAALLLVAALGALLVREALDPLAPCTGDEASWVSAGYLTFELVREAAPPARWASAYDERRMGDWGNKNPPLGKLLIGAAVALARRPGDTMRYGWDYSQGPDRNAAAGRVPPPHLLRAARLAVAGCAIVALLLAYALAVQLVGSHVATLLAPLLLYLAPPFVAQSTHAATDVPQVLLLLASAVALVAGLRAPWRRGLALCAAAGVLAGLSCAVKLSSGPAPAALALAAVVAPVWTLRRRAAAAALVLVVPVMAFVAADPYLWPQPLPRSLAIVRSWQATKVAQRSEAYLAGSAVTSRAQAARLVGLHGILWPTRIALPRGGSADRLAKATGATALLLLGALVGGARVRMKTDAERRRWTAAVVAGGLSTLLALAITGAPGLVPALVGLGLGSVADQGRDPTPAAAAARTLLALLATFALFTWLWLPFDWERYYLPVLIWTAPLLAAGGEAVRGAVRAVR